MATKYVEKLNINGDQYIIRSGENLIDVLYDTTAKKLKKETGSGTRDIVTTSQLKADMSLTKSDVGLGNVNNTSDANKPISTATQTALDGKKNTQTAVSDPSASGPADLLP